MIIYASPKAGKTYLSDRDDRYIDGDKVLFNILNKSFNVKLKDTEDKGEQILKLFRKNRVKAEKCYTEYMNWIKANKYNSDYDILIGSRRFMWLADEIYLKDSGNNNIKHAEVDSIKKWNLKGKFRVIKNKYLSDIL